MVLNTHWKAVLLWYDVIQTKHLLLQNMPAEYQILCRFDKSFARPHSQNPLGWLKASLKNHWSKEIWPPSSLD
jgi:hypothetical protein